MFKLKIGRIELPFWVLENMEQGSKGTGKLTYAANTRHLSIQCCFGSEEAAGSWYIKILLMYRTQQCF